MKFEFKVELAEASESDVILNNGQIKVSVPKERELRFNALNKQHQKELSKILRKFALKLIDHVDVEKSKSA